MKIGITSVQVSDPVSAFKFNTGVLGFTETLLIADQWLSIPVSSEDRDPTTLMLEPSHNAIAKRCQQPLYKAGIPVFVFTTSYIKKEHERLSGFGVRIRKERSRSENDIEALFEDGFGNIIQLYEA